MSRRPDPARKPELLSQILDFLLDKPLASLSFRTLATALGVSTFTLVYHFGTRAELVNEIVRAISARLNDIQTRLEANPGTMDTYFLGLEESWDWTLQAKNRQLQRLEFEACMLEAIDPASKSFTRTLYSTWQRIGIDALRALGLSAADAEVESRLLVDTFFGIQFDLVVNHEDARATAAFRRAIEHHRDRITNLVGATA